MHVLWRQLDITNRDHRLNITGQILGRHVETSASLTMDDARTVIDELSDWLETNDRKFDTHDP